MRKIFLRALQIILHGLMARTQAIGSLDRPQFHSARSKAWSETD